MRPKSVFICGTAFEDDLAGDPHGTKVYPSVETLKASAGCWDGCGIVEIEVPESVIWRVLPKRVAEPVTESRVDKAERREDLRCSFCPPHRGENAKRKPKRGAKKPKGKK